ncbi:hypothetical protein KCP69_22150 [Salmonella enterica subsp. enterica]|nr:hypothetical protein KCP69_22150 [Salmonella enterica subsp. enterica]
MATTFTLTASVTVCPATVRVAAFQHAISASPTRRQWRFSPARRFSLQPSA